MDALARGRSHRADGAFAGVFAGLRVALVHDWLTGLRGGEKCLEVLCGIFPDAVIHTLIHARGSTSPTIEQMRIRTSPLQWVPGIASHYRKWLPLMPAAAAAWDVRDADLVVSLSHCVAKSVRAPAGVPHVSYCFTPMRYVWENREKYFDTWKAKPLRKRLIAPLLDSLREWDRRTAAGVDHFIGISRTVQDRIRSSYGRESVLIPPPVDTTFYTPARVERDGPYLCVSALAPYKRIDHAVLAASEMGIPLEVIGKGPERARLEALAGPSVRFLGYQSDETIRDRLRRARALLFPGEEDFGIVPIEALACATPVIALGKGGAAETVDDRVGLVYPDESPAGLIDAIATWERLGRPFDPVEARRRAETFATPIYRERMIAYLSNVIQGRVPPGSELRGMHARTKPRAGVDRLAL